MTQAQMDIEVVKGWRAAALAAGEDRMIPFYDRLIVALERKMPKLREGAHRE